MRRILLFTFCINLISSVYAQKEDKRKTIDSLTTEMTISEGLINTYSNEENKLYFEISENLLGKDLLVVTRLAQLPGDYAGYLNAGSKTAEHVVQFEKHTNKILLREVSFTNISSIFDLANYTNSILNLDLTSSKYPPIFDSLDMKIR